MELVAVTKKKDRAEKAERAKVLTVGASKAERAREKGRQVLMKREKERRKSGCVEDPVIYNPPHLLVIEEQGRGVIGWSEPP